MDTILKLVKQEEKRQQQTLMMIPSENYTYPEVRKAVGSVLMHKYAEGQPKKRYYQGNENIDKVEELVETMALKAFKLNSKKWQVNVQAYSGTPANLAVYNTFLKPGDTIMAMFLPDGGHLSHGWIYNDKKITFTSKVFNIEFYHVNSKTEKLDYNEVLKTAKKAKPKLLISGGTAYPSEINHKKMAHIAKEVGAYYLADVAHEAGLIAAGTNASPFLYADAVTMTTHKTLRGPRGALVFVKKEYGDKLDSSIFPGLQGGPHLHTIAGIGVALEKSQSLQFKKYALQTILNAKVLAKELQKSKFHIVSGGTEKHLVLIDLRNKNTNGWFVAEALEVAGIIANRNTVPNETASPFYPSGLRIGSQALTVRGMKEREMRQIAKWIVEVVACVGEKLMPEDKLEREQEIKLFKSKILKDRALIAIKKDVEKLCKRFPLYLQ